ncbi:hypothetical protein [Actinokineospora terrae]|uniref:Uncharacterized protein n=1 Tax=Actinokineospora terrae TaxID=155974 RepID=A0A1H9Q369_9PSEU|nr:hypothetical protein [Actinokineospora terrae]SER54399.1 hypothetical protein SAMN04487818_10452 [Actinokineospora terrae]
MTTLAHRTAPFADVNPRLLAALIGDPELQARRSARQATSGTPNRKRRFLVGACLAIAAVVAGIIAWVSTVDDSGPQELHATLSLYSYEFAEGDQGCAGKGPRYADIVAGAPVMATVSYRDSVKRTYTGTLGRGKRVGDVTCDFDITIPGVDRRAVAVVFRVADREPVHFSGYYAEKGGAGLELDTGVYGPDDEVVAKPDYLGQ